MSFPIQAVHAAIFTALSTDADLMQMLGGPAIYDLAPRRAVHPYITFGPERSRRHVTESETIETCRLTLNIWTDTQGQSQLAAIAERITSVLTDETLSLSLSQDELVHLLVLGADITGRTNNRGMRATLPVRAVVHKTSSAN